MLDPILDEPSPELRSDASLNRRSPRRLKSILLGLTILAGLSFLGMQVAAKSNQPNSSEAQRPRSTPVTVANVTQKTVPVQLQAIGTVQAESTVSVTPQVGGQITGVYFQKGQTVQKGQLLFTLDDRPELAAVQQAQGTLAKDLALVQAARATLNKDLTLVRQAEATLAKDQAQATYAQSQNSRYGALYQQGAVSADQAQQYSANNQASAATLEADRAAIANAQAAVQVDAASIRNAEGTVKADQAALDSARVQLSYTKIYAPITGRAGDILVDRGNVVEANSTNPLVKIEQMRPIQVSFTVPEQNLAAIQRYMSNQKLNVTIAFPNSSIQPIAGVLSFVNNTVDTTTGTIQLMGDFDNAQGQLYPGQFVNATLTLTQQANAIVVPSQAVQTGPSGQFVFVVNPDQTVKNQPVTVSSMVNGLTVIEKGLQPGQTVVTDGQANLVEGDKVQIKSKPAGGQP